MSGEPGSEVQRLSAAGINQLSVGTQFVGLAATPRGAVNTAVALFTPVSAVRRIPAVGNPASAVGAEPIVHTPDANLGSSFRFFYRGFWYVEAALVIPASSVVNFGLNLNAQAADLVVATAPTVADGSRNFGFRRATVPAATEITLVSSGIVTVGQQNVGASVAQPKILRVIITNGAGAVVDPADVTVALAYINFTWLGDAA